jgi:hypothetical protein
MLFVEVVDAGQLKLLCKHLRHLVDRMIPERILRT